MKHARYHVSPERITLSGLAETQRRRRRLCASDIQPFSWLRFDTCTELVEGADDLPSIRDSRSVSHLFHDSLPFAGRNRESLMVLCLNAKNKPVGVATIATGGRNALGIEAAMIMQAVVLSGAVGFIVAHNHPSGAASPSGDDIILTGKLAQAAKALSVSLLDHVILTDDRDNFFSFLDNSLMER